MTGRPQVIVQCAFGSSPDAAAPVWTDISAYGQEGITWSRGRADEFSQPQPGTATLVLNNTDGRFTAGNASSPYYPNLLVGKRMRMSFVWQSVTYRMFDGFVDAWPTEWPTGVSADAQTPVGLTDRLKRLAAAQPLNGVLQEEALTDAPKGLWPMADAAGSSAASDLTGLALPLTFRRNGGVGTYEFGNSPGAGVDGMSGLLLSPTTIQGYYLAAQLSGISESQSFSVWFNTSRVGTAQGLMALRDPTYYLAAAMNSTGTIRVTSFPHAIATITSGSAYNDGIDHCLTVTRTRVGDVFTTRLYVDGLQVGSNATTLAGFPVYTPTAVYVGGMWPEATFPPFAGTLSDAGVYDGALTAGRVLAQYQAGATGGFAESTGARISRWARYLGLSTAGAVATVPNPSAAVDASGWTMVGATLARNTVLFDTSPASFMITWAAGAVNTEYARATVSGLTVGGEYTASARVNSAVGTPRLQIQAGLVNGGVNVADGTWQTVSTTFTASASTTFLYLLMANAATAGQLANFDTVTITTVPALNVDAGAGLMGAQQSAGQSALSLMQDAAAVENAPLFVAGNGQLRMRARTVRYFPVSTFTVGAEADAGNLHITLDEFGLFNDIAVTRTGGATFIRTDPASIAAYGDHSGSLTLSTSTDADAAAHAEWIVGTYATPIPRLATFPVDLDYQTSASLIAAVLAAEVGDLFTITTLPTQAPWASTTVFVEGVSGVLNPAEFKVTFNTSPGSVGSDVLALDDAAYGLDSTFRLAL